MKIVLCVWCNNEATCIYQNQKQYFYCKICADKTAEKYDNTLEFTEFKK